MTIESMPNSPELALFIQERRKELNLSITSAAKAAEVSPKTWSRYELGEPIRKDKLPSILKTLRLSSLPATDKENSIFDLGEFKNHPWWSIDLANMFNEYVAAAFIIGSEILMDDIESDIRELSKKPRWSHVGQLQCSLISDLLPPIYLTRYDYEFLWKTKKALEALIQRVSSKEPRGFVKAHSVIEELLFLAIAEEASFLMEEWEEKMDKEGIEYKKDPSADYDEDDEDSYCGYGEYTHEDGYNTDWVFDIFDDADIVTVFFNDDVPGGMIDPGRFKDMSGSYYDFDLWFNNQFYIEFMPTKEDILENLLRIGEKAIEMRK